jgi:hypothetical protein
VVIHPPTVVVRPVVPVAPAANPIPLIILPPVPVAPIVVNPVPSAPHPSTLPLVSGGASPTNPLNPTDAWQLLESGASVWYRIGTGGVQMEVFLDVDPPNSNVPLLIYAPAQLDKPIGRGTPYAPDRTRLVWNGGHWNANGDWLALVTNYNPMAVRYHLASSARDISNKTCHSYWEKIGTTPVFWTVCE